VLAKCLRSVFNKNMGINYPFLLQIWTSKNISFSFSQGYEYLSRMFKGVYMVSYSFHINVILGSHVLLTKRLERKNQRNLHMERRVGQGIL
jgi:hypothetical protein